MNLQSKKHELYINSCFLLCKFILLKSKRNVSDKLLCLVLFWQSFVFLYYFLIIQCHRFYSNLIRDYISLLTRSLTFTVFCFTLASVHEVFPIQLAKFLRKYEKRSHDNSIAPLSRDTIVQHYWLIWMQAVLEVNFGGVQAVLEKNAISIANFEADRSSFGTKHLVGWK